MKVAVLMGGRSSEREISLRTGQGVAQALRNLGHDVTSVDAADGAVLEAGAEGLALKTASPQQTLAAIRQVVAGQLVFPQAARRWLEAREASGPGDAVTEREREVWAQIAEGKTNVQIATALSLSENTVKFHVQHLFQKLGVKNRTEAALRFRGLDRPGGPPRR